jgi:hypothetical protein
MSLTRIIAGALAEGYVVDHGWRFSEFVKKGGSFEEVRSLEALYEKGRMVEEEIGFCRLFVDLRAGVLWLSGLGEDPQERYIYNFKAVP